MNIYLLKDKLTNLPAGVPFYCATDAAAVRETLAAFREHKDTLNQFDLFRIGIYDDKEGKIIDMQDVLVCNMTSGKSVINKQLGVE